MAFMQVTCTISHALISRQVGFITSRLFAMCYGLNAGIPTPQNFTGLVRLLELMPKMIVVIMASD